MIEDQTVEAEFIKDTAREDGYCRNLENNCEIGEKCECLQITVQRDLDEIDKIKHAQGIIDYAERRTVDEMIKEPGLYEASRTTIKYLKRYIENIN